METPLKLPLKFNIGTDGFATVRDADGHRVATDLQPNAAELLARACNVHQQLVDVLKAVRHEVGGTHPFSIHSNLPPELVHRIDAALAAAGAA